MILTEEQARERLNSPNNLTNRFANPEVKVTELKQPGNIEKPKLPEFLRTSIAILSRSGESQTSLAEAFNVTQPAIGAIERGETKCDEKAVEKVLGEVRDVALNKLMESLGLISTEKLAKCNAKDLSSVASNLSKVAANTLPNKNDVNGIAVNVQIFAPELRNERNFKTIEI